MAKIWRKRLNESKMGQKCCDREKQNKKTNKQKTLDKSVAKCIEREQKTEKRKGVQNVATEIKNEAKV